eukprot:tig00000361_g24362.t5
MPRRAARRGAAAAIASRLGLTSCDALDGRGVADGPPGHFCNLRSRGVGGGETGGALRTGGGFASGPGRVVPARAEARRAARGARRRLHCGSGSSGASWGEAGGARGLGGGVTSGPGLAARAGARRAVREGSVAASLPAQAGGARGHGGGFTSGPGLAARAGARRVAHGGSAAASLPAQRRELGRGGWRAGARWRRHFRPRSSGASWGEAGGALGHGGGFTSGPDLAARAGARRAARGARRRLVFRSRSSGASWGEAGGERGLGGGLSSGPGLAARAGARRAVRGGSVAASLPAQRRELGRGGRRAGARRRLHFRPRSSGASWGEAGGALGHGGGFTSGPGLAARAGARRAARGGSVAASLPAQRRELGRGGRRAGARRRLHFRPRSSGASWGEAGGARGHGDGFTSGPGLAARAGARRAARGARRRLHFRPRSSGASWGEAGGARGLGGGVTSGPGLAARAGARRAAREGAAAASLPAQRRELGRGGRCARARWRRHFRPRSSGASWGEAAARGGSVAASLPARSSGASWGEAGGALGHGGGFTSGPGPSSGASWGEAGGARGLGGGLISGPGRMAQWEARWLDPVRRSNQ